MRRWRSPGVRGAYAFLTNSDFRFIAPMPSILQAMLWPSLASVRRMFLTLVPPLTTADDPLTLRSFDDDAIGIDQHIAVDIADARLGRGLRCCGRLGAPF